MKHHPLAKFVILFIGLIVPIALLTSLYAPGRVARGKGGVLPLPDELNLEQQQAQTLALADGRVLDLAFGHRSEVFGVARVGQHFPASAAVCATAECWQVEIYNWDEDAAVTAIVNVDTAEVVEVLHQPGVQPGVNRRVAERAIDMAANDPRVAEELGFRPEQSALVPMTVGLNDSACSRGHLCLAPTVKIERGVLWIIIDMTLEKLVRLAWTGLPEDGRSVPFTGSGCPAPGTVTQGGWKVNYETTNTDGLRVYDVNYGGDIVLKSAKLLEWHADYGNWGFEDTTGCGGGGGGFPIYPYGETQVVDILDGGSNVIGFEVIQDFRMSQWGQGCNYRYEQHFQFYDDGRYRVVGGAYGQGCAVNALYRPIVRLDVAVSGDEDDNFALWDGSAWQYQTTENWWLQDQPYTAEGTKWLVTDASGSGYTIEPGQGQFGDGGRGDNAYIYVTLHKAHEGDTDMGIIGTCCYDDERQGPHQYVNGEAIANENIVIWYVPQMETDAFDPDIYCWTVSGEPNPETYPCFGGPMFVPVAETLQAGFSHNGPVTLGETAVFTNTTTGTEPITYTWDFGDGSPFSNAISPTYSYAATGNYTVTLTAQNTFGVSSVAGLLEVRPAPIYYYLPFARR